MRKPRRLAVMVPYYTTYGRGVVNGVREYCREHGQWDLYVEGSHPAVSIDSVSQVISQWRPAGLIAEIWLPQQMAVLRGCGIPVVDVSGTWDMEGLTCVHSDNEKVGVMVARHLMERGLQHFAFYGNAGVMHSRQRREAFAQELRSHGFECEVRDYDAKGPKEDYLAEWRALAQWLGKMDKPVGLMCTSDFRAREVIHACHQAGLRLPTDVALVGVGNDELTCDLTQTPISSVDVSPARVGYTAAGLLDRLMRGLKVPARPAVVDPAGLIVRSSSDILRTANEHVAAAMRFIQEHADTSIQVEDILKTIPVSRRALERNFREVLGRTPREQIFHVHVELAKRMLVETDLPLTAVAARSGFTSPFVLSGIFLRYAGMRPGAYRREYRFGAPGRRGSGTSTAQA